MATVLCFTAACKGDFAAGITGNGKDGSARETGALQDGANPNAQEAGHPTSSGSVSCNPFQPPTKPITLTNVLGAGRDTDGTLYVVDQPQPGGERVFVSSGTTLQRQRGAGAGTESSGNGVVSYTFTITDRTPPAMLKLETDANGPTAMGVLPNPPMDIKTFTIGQQGSVLTLVPASQVAALPVANIPAETFIEYKATLSDGRALLVVRPRDDWTYQDFRVFFGAPDHMAERSVDQVVRYKDGGSTTINFKIDGAAAVASFPVQLSPGGLVKGPATLTIGTTSFPLTLGPTDSQPAGESYFCFGNPSVDGGADAWVPPADGLPASCDPFQLVPLTLATVLGAGQDTDGTLYVIDRPQEAGSERVFVSSNGTLQRQYSAGSGVTGDGNGGFSYTYSLTNHVPPLTLRLDTNTAGPTAMGVFEGTLTTKTFTIGQQGIVLTLVPASQVATLPAADIAPLIDYSATLSDGRALLVVSSIQSNGYYGFYRVFFGTPNRMLERSVTTVNRDVNLTTIRFSVDGVAAVANFPFTTPGVPGSATLTIDNTQFPLTLQATTSPPTGYAYACLGDSSTDAGVDGLPVRPVDGPPVCRAPSPDYGPTSVFPFLPDGTPAATTTCPAACGDSAWPVLQSYPNIDTTLPYGSCTSGTPTCDVMARVPCACDLSWGPLHVFNCSCESGTWTCGIRVAGMAMCMPCPDAGVSDGRNDAAVVLKGVFVPTGSMTVARTQHTATLLPNGKVLIAGGQVSGPEDALGNTPVTASAELYDPTAGTFTATGSMTQARGGHTATLLQNGKVLIVDVGNSAESYDPAAGTFAATGDMTVPGGDHTATLLQSGKVLIAGGEGSAELYDPVAGTITATGNMTAWRYGHAATLLPSGKVLIAGGQSPGYESSFVSAELYDPTLRTFTLTGNMTEGRFGPTATSLPTGKVLITGGDGLSWTSAELYDSVAGTFAATGSMAVPRTNYTATLLPNGKVLIAGGGMGNTVRLASGELYQ
jgi:hypothetical protein